MFCIFVFCILYSVFCILYFVFCILYFVFCILYFVFFILYFVPASSSGHHLGRLSPNDVVQLRQSADVYIVGGLRHRLVLEFCSASAMMGT